MARKTKDAGKFIGERGFGRSTSNSESIAIAQDLQEQGDYYCEEVALEEFGGSAPSVYTGKSVFPDGEEQFALTSQILSNSASASPEEVQLALGQCMQILLASGIRNIKPPRNVLELDKLFRMWRTASGLDEVKGPSGPGLLGPGRGSFGRRATGPTLDAVPVDTPDDGDDGFDWPEGMD